MTSCPYVYIRQVFVFFLNLADLHQVTAALDGRTREEKESLAPVLQQLEAQTNSFQATTDRMSSNILADFEVMLQKQLSSSVEGYGHLSFPFAVGVNGSPFMAGVGSTLCSGNTDFSEFL